MSIPNSYLSNIQFLKLGGSLITDKSRPQTARLDVLERLASEIAQAYHKHPDLSLVIGHGSGSFGHGIMGLARELNPPKDGVGLLKSGRQPRY